MPATAPPTPAPRWQGLPPVASEHMVVLVLGSFPGVASLRAGQYYAHPHNQFWKILQALWPSHALPGDYAARCDWLLARGLGVWDVYASCEREGSLDTRIRNDEVNDFARLHGRCPRLAAIAHNGGESFKHARAVRASLGAHSAVESVRLPSTSPAHAAWSFDRKLNAWAALMASHGLI